MTFRIFTAALGVLMGLSVGTTVAQASTDLSEVTRQYAPVTTYAITRKGKRIGTHSISFLHEGTHLTVTVQSRIRVTVLTVPVFTFDYDASEHWRDNTLISAASEIRENNKVRNVSMESEGTETTLNNPAGRQTVNRLFFTSNHWNPAVTATDEVFNTLNGLASSVTITMVDQNAEINGLKATHYRYSGDIQADTWYSATGKWLKLQFKGDDGSLIEYTIEPQ